MNAPSPFPKNKKRPAVVNFHESSSEFASPKKPRHDNLPKTITEDGSVGRVNPGRFMNNERQKLPIFAVRAR